MNNIESPDCRDIKISVIMPIYNAYDYLRPAMDSVLDQTLRDIEIICVDDGSTDHSLDIIKEYQKQDQRIRILTETNAGPAVARNAGLKRARGEYVAFLDADDFFETDMLERMFEQAKRDDLDIVIAKYDIYNSKKARFRENIESEYAVIYDGGVVTSKNEHPDCILQSTSGFAWNKLFKRSFLLEKGISFLTEVRMFEDVYFTVTSLAFAERVGKLQSVLMHHRVYSEQTRARMYKKYFSQVPEVYLKIKEFLMKGGMYQPLSTGFLNLSASRCYHIYKLLPSDERENFWQLLHDGYTEKLGWADHKAEELEKDEIREFFANVQIYSHKQYLRRSSGARKSVLSVEQRLRRSKERKKLREFFAKIIGKGNRN